MLNLSYEQNYFAKYCCSHINVLVKIGHVVWVMSPHVSNNGIVDSCHGSLHGFCLKHRSIEVLKLMDR
jgi:hypothetical protein